MAQAKHIYKVLQKLSLYPMVFTQYGKIVTIIKQHASKLYIQEKGSKNTYIQKLCKMPCIKFISQKDDIGIKLKFQGINSLTILGGVAKLWMPQKFSPMGV